MNDHQESIKELMKYNDFSQLEIMTLVTEEFKIHKLLSILKEIHKEDTEYSVAKFIEWTLEQEEFPLSPEQVTIWQGILNKL